MDENQRPRSSSCQAKSIKERELSEADDEFAQLASEFDTIDELKADLRERLARVKVLEQGVMFFKDLVRVREKYGDERRTQIVPEEGEISLEDLIKEISGRQIDLDDMGFDPMDVEMLFSGSESEISTLLKDEVELAAADDLTDGALGDFLQCLVRIAHVECVRHRLRAPVLHGDIDVDEILVARDRLADLGSRHVVDHQLARRAQGDAVQPGARRSADDTTDVEDVVQQWQRIAVSPALSLTVPPYTVSG